MILRQPCFHLACRPYAAAVNETGKTWNMYSAGTFGGLGGVRDLGDQVE